MSALGSRNNGSVRDKRIVDTRERNQVGLELVEIDVKSTIETKRRGDGRNDLSDQAVQVLVARTRNIEVSSANVIHSLVIDKEGNITVFEGAVGSKDGVVGLNNGGGDARGRVDGEPVPRTLSAKVTDIKGLRHQSCPSSESHNPVFSSGWPNSRRVRTPC